jgi:hypothetical protein
MPNVSWVVLVCHKIKMKPHGISNCRLTVVVRITSGIMPNVSYQGLISRKIRLKQLVEHAPPRILYLYFGVPNGRSEDL